MDRATADKWDRIHGAAGPVGDPSPTLVEAAPYLPAAGRALDVAGGTGRNARWLAERGLDVTVADISRVGLARAASFGVRTVHRDLEQEGLPAGPWDLVVCVSYLWRPLFSQVADALAPGGILVVAHPTRTNLERNPRPSARFLLDDGELPSLVADLTVERYCEGWRDGCHLAELVARRR